MAEQPGVCCNGSVRSCKRRRSCSSHAQKNFPAVQKSSQRNRQQKTNACAHQMAGPRSNVCVEEVAHVTSRQSSGEPFEVNDVLGKVERDGIGADPDEGRGPALMFPNVDNLMKHAEQHRAESTCDENVGGSPNLFDD